MTAWWSGRAVLFDLETDGVDPEDARIITACSASVQPAVAADVTNWMARPERDIPEEAAGVHGITTAIAQEKGGPREDVVAGIAYSLAEWAGEAAPVVGHHLAYDFTVLDREMRRLGIGLSLRSGSALPLPSVSYPGPTGMDPSGSGWAPSLRLMPAARARRSDISFLSVTVRSC